MTGITWPIAILDFEASGLSRFSYPIEVGFARWRGLDAPIESWSTLIRPDHDWTYWSEEAEAIMASAGMNRTKRCRQGRSAHA